VALGEIESVVQIVTETFETEDFDIATLAAYGLVEAFRIWSEARPPDRRFPARADIDIVLFKDMLSRLTLYDVIDGGRDFRYRVHSTDSAALLRDERTGKRRSEIPQPPERAARMDALLGRIVASGRPLLSRLPSQTREQPPHLTRLFLPLGNDGAVVDMILVVREPTGRNLSGPYL
jgi:hypothetical protein